MPQSNEPYYYDFYYINAKGERTDYDLQETRYDDGRLPTYVISESPINSGPGFDDALTRDAVSHDAARNALILNDPRTFPEVTQELLPSDIRLFQQRPDGDFDRVEFRITGATARSNVDVEWEQNDPASYKIYQQEQNANQPSPGALPITEWSRTQTSREEVEAQVEETLYAQEQSPQQQQLSQWNEQWRELSAPSLDRTAIDPAELSRNSAQVYGTEDRSQEQSQQMNQHRDQHQQSQDL